MSHGLRHPLLMTKNVESIIETLSGARRIVGSVEWKCNNSKNCKCALLFCLRSRSRSSRKHTVLFSLGGWSLDRAECQFFLDWGAFTFGGWSFSCRAGSKEFLAWVAWAMWVCEERSCLFQGRGQAGLDKWSQVQFPPCASVFFSLPKLHQCGLVTFLSTLLILSSQN